MVPKEYKDVSADEKLEKMLKNVPLIVFINGKTKQP